MFHRVEANVSGRKLYDVSNLELMFYPSIGWRGVSIAQRAEDYNRNDGNSADCQDMKLADQVKVGHCRAGL